jgi:predicted nucleic acid-binding protein
MPTPPSANRRAAWREPLDSAASHAPQRWRSFSLKKATVYLDTSVISAFWYEGANVAMLARRLSTREWWDLERRHFTVSTSVFTETELRAGTFPRQNESLKTVRRLGYLSVTTEVRDLIREIVRRKIVPGTKATDAAHLAISATHGYDYLLTWNYAHMVNPVVQARFDQLCDAAQLVAPLMVSPESIPQARFGQSIRRRR